MYDNIQSPSPIPVERCHLISKLFSFLSYYIHNIIYNVMYVSVYYYC